MWRILLRPTHSARMQLCTYFLSAEVSTSLVHEAAVPLSTTVSFSSLVLLRKINYTQNDALEEIHPLYIQAKHMQKTPLNCVHKYSIVNEIITLWKDWILHLQESWTPFRILLGQLLHICPNLLQLPKHHLKRHSFRYVLQMMPEKKYRVFHC